MIALPDATNGPSVITVTHGRHVLVTGSRRTTVIASNAAPSPELLHRVAVAPRPLPLELAVEWERDGAAAWADDDHGAGILTLAATYAERTVVLLGCFLAHAAAVRARTGSERRAVRRAARLAEAWAYGEASRNEVADHYQLSDVYHRHVYRDALTLLRFVIWGPLMIADETFGGHGLTKLLPRDGRAADGLRAVFPCPSAAHLNAPPDDATERRPGRR